MITFARAAGLAATLTLIAAPCAEAQVSSIRITLGGGPHAGTYELKEGQCDALDGSVISMFTPELAGMAAGPKIPESMEVYTVPAEGKPDGFAVNVDFRAKSGERVVYEIYAIPPELQGPGVSEPLLGKGRVTIQPGDARTTATFSGETKDGVKMEGSVTCVKRR
jgi:hypothetical protein